MKKIVSILLALALVLSVVFALASCNFDFDDQPYTEESTSKEYEEPNFGDDEEDDDDDNDGTSVDWDKIIGKPESPVSPEDSEDPKGEYELQIFGDIQFEIPSSYEVWLDEYSFSATNEETEAYITVNTEENTGMYKNMNADMYDQIFGSLYEQLGIEIKSVSIQRDSVGDIEYIALYQVFEYGGEEVEIVQVIIAVGNYYYFFNFSDVEEDVYEHVLESVNYKDLTPPQTATEDGTYTFGEINIDYMAGSIISATEDSVVLGDAVNRVGISVTESDGMSREDITMDMYEEELKPTYEAFGYTTMSVYISHKTNLKGVEYTSIEQHFAIAGFEIQINQYFVFVGDSAYILNFYNTYPDFESAMINSISIAN